MNKKIKGLIVLTVSLLTMIPFDKVLAQSSKYYNVTRIYGQDRYETSVNISKQFDSGELKNVILASGKDFPDALTGSVLSKKLNAPILLVGDLNSGCEYETEEYIAAHLSKDGTIYLLGGEGSISPSVVSQLNQLGYKNFKRLGGNDRFATNSIIVDEMNVQNGTPVVIVNGFNFPDALSVSSVAGSKGYPIFMSKQNAIGDSTVQKISAINPSKVYMIGGEGALSNNIKNQLKSNLSYLKDEDIVRINGSNRYETSLKINDYFKLDSKYAILANGENFPDALSGSALASKLNAPIILTYGKNTDNQKNYLDSSDYTNITILGGQGSVENDIENSFNGTKLDLKGQFQGGIITDLKTFDINNDGKLENIILTMNENESENNVTLYLQDALTGKIIASKVVGGSYSRYNHELRLVDINGDGKPDIVSIIPDGGNSGMESCDIESVSDDGLVKIDNYKDGEKPSPQLNSMSEDNFNFNLQGYDAFNMYSKNLNKSCSVDLTYDKLMQSGKSYGKDVEPWMGHGPMYKLYNIDNSGVYGLKVYQDVSGTCHADVLGGFCAYYKYEDGIMKLVDMNFFSGYPMKQN